jgi:hypothetical protein
LLELHAAESVTDGSPGLVGFLNDDKPVSAFPDKFRQRLMLFSRAAQIDHNTGYAPEDSRINALSVSSRVLRASCHGCSDVVIDSSNIFDLAPMRIDASLLTADKSVIIHDRSMT